MKLKIELVLENCGHFPIEIVVYYHFGLALKNLCSRVLYEKNLVRLVLIFYEVTSFEKVH